jgi:hypothetical protein
MSNQNFDDFWSIRGTWSIDKVCWTKGVQRQINQLFLESGPMGITPTQIARIAKWTTHEAMCLIEYLVSMDAVKRRHDNIRRYAINPKFSGDILTTCFT